MKNGWYEKLAQIVLLGFIAIWNIYLDNDKRDSNDSTFQSLSIKQSTVFFYTRNWIQTEK